MLEDQKGAELLYMLAEKHMQQIVKHDRGAVVGKVDSLSVGEHYHVAVDGSLDLTAGAAKSSAHIDMKADRIEISLDDAKVVIEKDTITLKAKKKIRIESEEGPIELFAKKGDVKIETQKGEINLKGGPNVKINCKDEKKKDDKDKKPGKAGGSGGGGSGGGGGAGGGTEADKPPKTGLGSDVDAAAGKSKTLTDKINQMQSDGWSVKYGEDGAGSFTNAGEKTVVLDGNLEGDTEGTLSMLSHEVGHATWKTPEIPFEAAFAQGMSKEDFVSQNVHADLLSEAEATLTSSQIQQELAANGGPSIAVPGAHASEYQQTYQDYLQDGDRDAAREQIASIFGDGEHPSTSPNQTYNQYYQGAAASQWDELIKQVKH
jgi:type VI secretion system secreted protein VgrG